MQNTTTSKDPVLQTLTPKQWRALEKGDLETPICPHCNEWHLGIQTGMFREDGRDVWKCDSGCNKAFHTASMLITPED